jgi:CheY-like chemotaxis protein
MAGELILSIEDDAGTRRLITLLLEEAGYEVALAEAGDEGLIAMRSRQPDCVLIDIGLPRLTGDMVLEAMKADPAIAHIPAVVVSAWGEDAVADRARRLGAHDVIMKPFTDDALLDAVRSAIRHRPR